MFGLLNAIILGIVEGITEFLPVSSTAHLMLTSEILKIPPSQFLKTFEISIQSGAILAVVILYFRSFFDVEILKRLAVAFIPTGIIGLLFYKIVKNFFLENITIVLWSLAIGGIALVVLEKYVFRENTDESEIKNISYLHCLLIGLFQSIAIVPGVSRSAATIVGGLMLKIPRYTIVEFSFLLAVPTMLVATGYDLAKNAGTFETSQFWFLAIGFVASFLTAILAIRWLLGFVKKRNFVLFGIYRLLLVLVFLLYLGYVR